MSKFYTGVHKSRTPCRRCAFFFFYPGAGYFWILNVGFASYDHSVVKNFEVAVNIFDFTSQVQVNTNYVTRNRFFVLNKRLHQKIQGVLKAVLPHTQHE
jgi:hypothetical protein